VAVPEESMERKFRDLARACFGIPPDMTDAEMQEILVKLNDLPSEPDELRVGNYLKLADLRKKNWPARPSPFTILNPIDLFWIHRCEVLFTQGEAGPCCVWARATVEWELQEQCLKSPKVSESFRNKILNPGKNPGLRDCMNELGDTICKSTKDACDRVAENGDAVVHHRLDRIAKIDLNTWLKQRGFSLPTLDVSRSGKDAREDAIAMRFIQEEEMANESMASLYVFEAGIH
jgi:hypothetical protein